MKPLRERLQEQLQRFDDEAFAALGNRGLLRRAYKDLESQDVAVAEESAETLVLGFAGQRIAFDARGPAFARCDCPASGVCQHVLAAAIGLRKLAAPTVAAGEGAVEAETSAPTVTPPDLDAQLRALSAFTVEQMRKHAGLPGYRWAWQHVHDIEPARDLEIGGQQHLVLKLARPRVTFRMLGEGLEGLVADLDSSQLAKYRVAAVLAFRRATGLLIEPPPQAARAATLDLGKDHALAEGQSATRSDSRERIRASVRGLLCECVELGVSHLSEAVQQRFATLAVWAQGAEYYRLAMLLRRLADQVELLLERAGAADEHLLLDDMSLALALVAALDVAALADSEPPTLVGRSRTKYEDLPAISLYGLGAWPWRSQTGYHGLSMLFWCPDSAQFHTCTDARPEAQRGFSPRQRHAQAGPWSGLASPASAQGKRIELSGARLNAQGRLSANESANANVREADAAMLAGLQALHQWSDVHEHWASARRSLLAQPEPMRDWVLLAPASVAGAGFDEVRQCFELALLDAEGGALPVELMYSELHEHAITRLEALAKDWPPGARLLGRLRLGDGRLVVEPLGLLRADTGGTVVDALHFDATPKSTGIPWGALFERFRAKENAQRTQLLRADRVPPSLRAVREWLCRRAERGLAGVPASLDLSGYARLVERADNAGLTCLPRIDSSTRMAEQLLRANYVYLQYLRLMGVENGAAEDEAEPAE